MGEREDQSRDALGSHLQSPAKMPLPPSLSAANVFMRQGEASDLLPSRMQAILSSQWMGKNLPEITYRERKSRMSPETSH